MTSKLGRAIQVAIVCGVFAPIPTVGQSSDRVAVRFSPKSGQVLQTRTTTDIAFVVDGGSPTQFESKAVTAITSTFGYADDAGRFESDSVIDEFSISTAINGTVVPPPAVQTPLVGRHIGATYDSTGTAVDVRVPEDLGPASAVFKQMLASVNRGFPIGETIGVGETITRPLDFTLAAPGQTAATPLTLRMSLTLDGITTEEADRIARFTVSLDGSTAGGAVSMPPLVIRGTGTLEWNVDRGAPRANHLDYQLVLSTPAGDANGTIRINSVTR